MIFVAVALTSAHVFPFIFECSDFLLAHHKAPPVNGYTVTPSRTPSREKNFAKANVALAS